MSWIVPVELSVRLPSLAGQGADAAAVAPSEPAVALAGPRRSEADDYANRRGYDPGFLRVVEVPLPRLRDSVRGDAARKLKVADGEDPFELKYHHFSVVMNRRRKLTFFTACNIDGATAKSIKRSTRAVSDLSATDLGLREAVDALEDAEADSWRHDLRLSREDYSGVEIYERQKVPGFPNPRSKQRILRMFQKGHLVRRLDPAWGTANQALEAELDTFHWTNAAPQVGFFNMGAADEDQPGTGGGKLWRAAENYVLRNAVDEDMPVTSFTGPIFRDDDRPYRNIQIPGSFFKVTIWEDEGTLRSLACIVDQSQVFREWPENLDAAPEAFLDPDELKRVRDFLSTVAEVEALTGIDFGEAVREADIRRGESPREVKSDDDLPFAGPVDDLTRINGLGPVFATRLRARGVTTFAQIAGWNEAEITNMDDRIVARGNIKRDDWVGQARKLAARDRPRRRHVRPEEILSGDLKWSDVTNPMEPPWNAIGALFDSNSRFVGTAWIAGSRTAICAAHMVHGAGPFSLELPGGAIEIEGDAILPSEFTGADREESKRVDIAVLQLAAAVTVPEIPLGDSWGSIGVVAGYFRDGGSLRFTNNAGLLGPENDDYLLHRADTEGGHSGSPILVESAGGVWSAVALHVGGLERHPLNVTRRNTALRLNFDRLKFLKENLS